MKLTYEPEYPGFTKAREDWKADPHCRACGRHTDTVNSLTGVMCRYCLEIWYDGPRPPDGAERWTPATLGAECKRAEAAGEWPFHQR